MARRLPGARLLAIARHWFDATTVSSVFEPLVADWQRDCERSDRSRLVAYLDGFIAFLTTLLVSVPRLLDQSAPRHVHFRAAVGVSVFAVAGALLQVAFLVTVHPLVRSVPAWHLLLPSAIALSVPFACLPVGLLMRRALSPESRRSIPLAWALVLTLLALLSLGWWSPGANQQWRIAALQTMNEVAGGHDRREPSRGINEVSLTELLVGDQRRLAGIGTPAEIRYGRQNKLSLLLLPPIMWAIGWGLAGLMGVRGGFASVGWWFAFGFGWTLLRTAEFEGWLFSVISAPPERYPWTVVTAFACLAWMLNRAANRRIGSLA